MTIHRPSVLTPAPPIMNRCVGPQSVTSSPKSACQKASSGKPSSATPPQTSITIPPGLMLRRSGRRRSLRAAGPPHPAVQQRGEDDALQADHDEHVRRGEHALVAAVIDVVADVPVHPEDRDLQRDAGEDDGRDEAPRDSRDALLVADEAMDELHG